MSWHVTQPIDQDDPGRGTFRQEVSLQHRDERWPVPLIVVTSGYADTYADRAHELTRLLAANQVSIEHRYFGGSRPADPDWTKLTIAQMAADEHAIIVALRTIYQGAVVTTGGSKGGMTAMFHRRLYPDDAAGTVPYVAPLSLGAPDHRYAPFLDTVGWIDCRQAVRDVATELLARRRAAIHARAAGQTGPRYTRVALGPAVEAAIANLEWTFWQYYGTDQCGAVLPVSADDDTLFAFLDRVSPVAGSSDQQLVEYEAYYYQADSQLGYPDPGAAYLAPYLMYGERDYDGELPTAEPTYDPAAMRDIDEYVERRGAHLVFVYGEWDPWTAGRFALGDARDALTLVQAHGTHAARIANLAITDRDAAFSRLQAWTGVAPMPSRLRAAEATAGVVELHPPAARVRALRARK